VEQALRRRAFGSAAAAGVCGGWQIGNPDLIVKAENPTICRRAERINTGILFPHAGEENPLAESAGDQAWR